VQGEIIWRDRTLPIHPLFRRSTFRATAARAACSPKIRWKDSATRFQSACAFELDVGMTRDGVVVVSHDPAINPDITRDASGAWLTERGPLLRGLTYAELCRYDVGRIRPGSAYAAL